MTGRCGQALRPPANQKPHDSLTVFRRACSRRTSSRSSGPSASRSPPPAAPTVRTPPPTPHLPPRLSSLRRVDSHAHALACAPPRPSARRRGIRGLRRGLPQSRRLWGVPQMPRASPKAPSRPCPSPALASASPLTRRTPPSRAATAGQRALPAPRGYPRGCPPGRVRRLHRPLLRHRALAPGPRRGDPPPPPPLSPALTNPFLPTAACLSLLGLLPNPQVRMSLRGLPPDLLRTREVALALRALAALAVGDYLWLCRAAEAPDAAVPALLRGMLRMRLPQARAGGGGGRGCALSSPGALRSWLRLCGLRGGHAHAAAPTPAAAGEGEGAPGDVHSVQAGASRGRGEGAASAGGRRGDRCALLLASPPVRSPVSVATLARRGSGLTELAVRALRRGVRSSCGGAGEGEHGGAEERRSEVVRGRGGGVQAARPRLCKMKAELTIFVYTAVQERWSASTLQKGVVTRGASRGGGCRCAERPSRVFLVLILGTPLAPQRRSQPAASAQRFLIRRDDSHEAAAAAAAARCLCSPADKAMVVAGRLQFSCHLTSQRWTAAGRPSCAF